MSVWETLLSVSIVVGFALLVISKFTNKSISELLEGLNNMFRRGDEDE